ncbi:hypothetical protein BR93DRAFT_936950 [Coniochaeta sp. PMI_546]|nr:hypothetical protein BR93DRAFT_936950 [Coniochaeta sp. PMI_546]
MAQPNVTLPPIHGIYQQSYGPSSGPGNPPPVDPRLAPSNYAASPTAANGHGPPPPGPPPQPAPYPQYHGPPPGGHHGAPPPGGPPPPPGPYADYYSMQHRPSSYPAPPPNGYGPYQGYPGGPPYGEYVQGGHPQQQQIAPRQRTSIACRYCRKRKIRCSGYQNTTNGKCTNCDKLKIDCIFQPVSSGVSQAFIPVSAIPGGVPPGTQLFGAYGQPLPPSGPGQSQNGYPPPPGYQQHQQQQQQAPLASPTSQYAPQAEGAQHGRRRPRESDEEDRNARLPPPPPPDAYHQSYDSRRRSPVSADSNTPPMYHYQHSTRSFEADRTPTPRRNSVGHSPTTSTMSTGVHSPTSTSFPPPAPAPHGLAPPHSGSQMPSISSRSPVAQATNGGRSPTANGLPAPGAKSPTTGPDGASSSSIMSLGNLVQGPPPSMPFRGSDIDGSMLGKLNRRS